MLKHIIFIIIIILVSLSCNSDPEGYVIKGKLKNAAGKTLHLDRITVSKVETIDSIKIRDDGNYKFSGKLSEPGIFILRFSNSNFCYLIADTTDKIEVMADAENLLRTYTVKGSFNSALLREVSIHNLSSMKKVDSVRSILKNYEANQKYDSVKKALGNSFNLILNDEKSFLASFIRTNKCSFASFMALYQQLGSRNYVFNISNDFDYFNMVDSCLYQKYHNSSFIASLHSQVAQIQNENYAKSHARFYNTGDFADEIILTSPDGKTVKLSSLKGKYVLLDFWASWCKPCRAENPNIVENYNKYHSKGFEIYSISLDQDKQAWTKAIRADNLNWIHVSDLKGWNSPLAIQYKIDGIPANFLLDKDGKIIGKNLRGNELGVKLAEVFK